MCRQRVYLMGRQAIIPKHEGRAATLEYKRDVERGRERERDEERRQREIDREREGEKKRVSV